MFEWMGTIRFSETDQRGLLTLPALMNYFQDVFDMDSSRPQTGSVLVKEKGLGWMVAFWQVDLLRRPQKGEQVIFRTFPHTISKLIAHRNFQMLSPAGDVLAQGNSVWLLMDKQTHKIVRFPEEILRVFPPEEPLPMAYLPRRVRISSNMQWETIGTHVVRLHELDVNQHLNNVSAVRILMGAWEEQDALLPYSRIGIEYQKEVQRGDRLFIHQGWTDGVLYLRLAAEDGTPMVTARLDGFDPEDMERKR